MNSLTIRAYAKINLTLDVGERRPDGYHSIRSIMQTIALHDTLTVTLTPDISRVRLEVIGEKAAGVPADASNLVHRAASLLAGPESGLHILLHKRIPSQAGLGGGSSDAAATIWAVNILRGLGLSSEQLADRGAALGADVPFFFTGGTALVEGLGELITPLPPLTPPWVLVLAKPSVGVSTAAAYAALDAVTDRIPRAATAAWLRGKERLSNDFEPIISGGSSAIAAILASLRRTAESGECFRPLLCGSGATVFCRVSTVEKAEQIAEQLRKTRGVSAWVSTTQEAAG